jgi:hypothetical protein
LAKSVSMTPIDNPNCMNRGQTMIQRGAAP